MTKSATGKRYIDLPGVQLNESDIPSPLLPLLEVAKEWAIVGDNALEKAIQKTEKQKIRTAVNLARPLKDNIEKFAFESNGASATPVPDEVVIFQMFAWSLKRLEVEVR